MPDLPFAEPQHDRVLPQAELEQIRQSLDSLAEGDRRLLGQAAVLGETFTAAPLAALESEDLLATLQRLDALVRRTDLIVADGQEFRFAHSHCRETLLATMTPALEEAYRQRLSPAPALLPVEESVFHRIHSDDASREFAALIQKGDRARDLSDWPHSLRFYAEALWLAQKTPETPSQLRGLLYERIGDLQFTAAREPQIARGHYEAALGAASRSADRIRLLCRIAETYRAEYSTHAEFYAHLEQAGQLLEQVEDQSTRVYLQCIQAEVALGQNDLPRAYQLADQVSQTQGAPGEVLLRSHRLLMVLAGLRRSAESIQRHALAIEPSTPDSWAMGRHLCSVANAYGEAGQPRRAREHMLRAARLFEKLDRQVEVTECLVGAGKYALDMGDYESARQYLRQGLRQHSPKFHPWFAYTVRCRTWWFDQSPEGVAWAADYVEDCDRTWSADSRRDANRDMKLHRFGLAERIYREHGRERDFQQRLERMRTRLENAGFQTTGIWYFGDPVEPPSLPPAADLSSWQLILGDSGNACTRKNGLVFSCLPMRGFLQLDMPQLLHPVAGDFALQATLPGADQLLPELVRCRREAGTGHLAQNALGGGGLLLLKDPGNALRLFAHLQAPGEIICTLRHNGVDRTLGRGLLPDAPIHLRLERSGTTLRAYAGTDDAWFLCGQADLNGWESARVGLFGECLIELYPLVERAETRFTDIRLHTASTALPNGPDEDALYPLPEPVYDPDLPGFVAAGRKMRRLLEQIRATTPTDTPVLVQGETGTGKELVARALHQLGERGDGPFITLNCAALPAELLERELFGHQRGAFTGAYQSRSGLFEAADGGILLLDEIGDASPRFQARLLRVIEEQAVRRLGDTHLRRIDVRVVAATHRDLGQAVQQGSFRRDLYYRLKGAFLTVPPLRQRVEGIPHLVHHALRGWAEPRQGAIPSVTRQAMEVLCTHDWPGNVRELIHELERAATAAAGRPISPRELSIGAAESTTGSASAADQAQEAQRIGQALQAAGGNRSEAARRLGISRVTLYRRIHRLGLTELLKDDRN